MFERVCLSVYVCMPQTYIHKPNIHTQLEDLPYRKAFQEALERVCIFKNPLPVMKKSSNIHERHTLTQTHAKGLHIHKHTLVPAAKPPADILNRCMGA